MRYIGPTINTNVVSQLIIVTPNFNGKMFISIEFFVVNVTTAASVTITTKKHTGTQKSIKLLYTDHYIL